MFSDLRGCVVVEPQDQEFVSALMTFFLSELKLTTVVRRDDPVIVDVNALSKISEFDVVIAWAGSPQARAVAQQLSSSIVYYGLDKDDCAEITPVWYGACVSAYEDMRPFDLFVGGSFCGRWMSSVLGEQAIRNSIASIAFFVEVYKVPLHTLMSILPRFRVHHLQRSNEPSRTASRVTLPVVP